MKEKVEDVCDKMMRWKREEEKEEKPTLLPKLKQKSNLRRGWSKFEGKERVEGEKSPNPPWTSPYPSPFPPSTNPHPKTSSESIQVKTQAQGKDEMAVVMERQDDDDKSKGAMKMVTVVTGTSCLAAENLL